MDIKQMGGGDSLYDKIDLGVRGSKLVISCVTKKYALSANCRREVSLSDALKRPIIPLLLEDLTWPPEGPMGTVFDQLLYIDFSKPDVSIQNEWTCPQFDQLLKKINQHFPDYSELNKSSKSIYDQMLDEISEEDTPSVVDKQNKPTEHNAITNKEHNVPNYDKTQVLTPSPPKNKPNSSTTEVRSPNVMHNTPSHQTKSGACVIL